MKRAERKADASRALIVCPAAGATVAAETAKALGATAGGGPQIDLLVYGRLTDRLPMPPGVNQLSLPDVGASRGERALGVVRFVEALRRRRYALAVIAHPELGQSRVRGALLFFPFLARARNVAIVDQAIESMRPVSRSAAITDLLRWCAIQMGSTLVAGLASAVLARMGHNIAAPLAIPRTGRVLYLRTDVELSVAPLEPGGAAAHTDGIVRALNRRGHDVEIWSTGTITGSLPEVPERRLPVIRRGNLPTEISELLSSLVQALRAPRGARAPGFVYQRYSLNNLTGVLLARRCGVPLVLEANAAEARWRQQRSTLRFPKLAASSERHILASADRIVAVSSNAANDLLAAGADARRIRVVPNGVDVECFAGATPHPLPFPHDAFVVCFAGLFYPWHGVRYLAEAFVRVAFADPAVRLLLVGDGETADSVREILKRAELDARVHMPGMVPRQDVSGYLAAADILVSPHAETDAFIGSPVKIFEYMAAGRAIVASNVAQIGELLRDEETALLVTPADSEALADGIRRLHHDSGLRKRLGQTAQAEASHLHSWDTRLAASLDGQVEG